MNIPKRKGVGVPTDVVRIQEIRARLDFFQRCLEVPAFHRLRFVDPTLLGEAKAGPLVSRPCVPCWIEGLIERCQ